MFIVKHNKIFYTFPYKNMKAFCSSLPAERRTPRALSWCKKVLSSFFYEFFEPSKKKLNVTVFAAE